MREAEGAFGDPTAFIEQAVGRPRHIEVQILADTTGARDAPVRARLLDPAPPPEGRRDRPGAEHLRPSCATRLCARRRRVRPSIGYSSAGTVEFLVETEGERAGKHVFIEMNPRIQVEHTVTEEITDVDLVQSQMRIAAGESLADLGITQDTVRINGAALQCRITTEDPANGFRPDTGTIIAYRSPAGAGVRLDGATVDTGVEISPHFDSMLVKLTCRGRDFPAAVTRARRALAEFRIRGVSTNIPFLQAVLADPDFIAGRPVDGVHRGAPELLDHQGARRPRHPAAALARPTSPSTSRTARRRRCSTRATSCPPVSTWASPSPPVRGSDCSSWPAGLRRGPAAARRRRGHRHDLPRRTPVPARHPRADQVDLLRGRAVRRPY